MTVLARNHRRGRAVVALAAVCGLTLGASGTASAAAGPASCMGHEASSISPPGSSEEVPGGMPALIEFVRGAVPGPVGGFVSHAARLHAGSHEACDEALE